MTKRIYIAGPIRSQDPIQMLLNIRAGIDEFAWLISKGFHCFCPHLDFQAVLNGYGSLLTAELLQANSMAWVEKCDAMLVLPGWELSCGTKAEMDRAQMAGVVIYHDAEQLVRELGE